MFGCNLNVSLLLSSSHNRVPSLANASSLVSDMSHNALVDLTGSSDEEQSAQSRSTSSKRLRLHHDGRYSIMRSSNLVDLTGEEQDFPYLQSGALGSPFPRCQPRVYRPPILVDIESQIAITQSDATSSLLNQAPVYKDIDQINGALMKLNGYPLTRMTVSRSPGRDKRQEDLRILQQPAINPNISTPLPKNVPSALTDNEKTLAQDYTSRLHTSIVAHSTATEHGEPVSQMRENLRVSSPVAMSYATQDAERQSTEIEDPKELPLTLEAFQGTLQKCLYELRGDHQYYIKVSTSDIFHAYCAQRT